MSEDKEPKPETTEVEKTEKVEKPKKKKVTKKVTKNNAPKDKKKKIVKKKTVKKAVGDAVKDKKKAVVKKTKKTTEKKPTKKTTEKKAAKKAAPKKESSKKAAPMKEKKVAEKESKFTKYQVWVAEAIASLSTEEKQYVSAQRVKDYLIDYMDGSIFSMIPKLSKKALLDLTEKKLLKRKKESFAFTSKGKEKLCPEKVPKRKKIDRPVKEKPVEKEEAPVQEEFITMTGRPSRKTVLRDYA